MFESVYIGWENGSTAQVVFVIIKNLMYISNALFQTQHVGWLKVVNNDYIYIHTLAHCDATM